MTSEEQRIAIAKNVGWKYIMGDWVAPDATSLRIKRTASDCDTYTYPPDYLNDLNAMHEVEGAMVSSQWMEFEWQLTQVIERQHSDAYLRHFINATAAQRAEAYLRTIGKWKD